MNVVVLGGTRFVGPYVVRLLAERGHEVTIVHRGETEAELPRVVRHLHVAFERLPEALERLRSVAVDVVLDMVPYLDPNDRALLMLRYLHGFDSQELGEVFRMTPEAIRQRLSRLRRRLRLAAAPAEGLDERPRGLDVQRYTELSSEELETDAAFARFLAPLARVQPVAARRQWAGRRR